MWVQVLPSEANSGFQGSIRVISNSMNIRLVVVFLEGS